LTGFFDAAPIKRSHEIYKGMSRRSKEALIYVASDERLTAAGTEKPEFTRQ
jgi:hypothetical protein